MFTVDTVFNTYSIQPGTITFVIPSPVTCPRTQESLKAAIGPMIEIRGTRYEPVSFGFYLPATPIGIDEVIAISVRPIGQPRNPRRDIPSFIVCACMCIAILSTRLTNPHLTETELFLKYWEHYLVSILLTFCLLLIVRKK